MANNWKLTLAYDGTDFYGWQVQPGLETIQGTLADAIARVTGERVLPQGSGRTDAGVHALGQVATFLLAAPIPEAALLRALDRVLPASIRVLTVQHAPMDFHARHSALRKTYQYRVFPGDRCSPFMARTVYAYRWPLDLAAMQQAAQYVLGKHDFASFAATDPDLAQRNRMAIANTDDADEAGTVRTIDTSTWSQNAAAAPEITLAGYAPALLVYTVRGNGFLHHMVRNLVGTFLEVGRGRWKPEDVPAILAARDRRQAGPTAPASGLVLVQVEYPTEEALEKP
jgi:tRNA pseudouridine38-40 synthase